MPCWFAIVTQRRGCLWQCARHWVFRSFFSTNFPSIKCYHFRSYPVLCSHIFATLAYVCVRFKYNKTDLMTQVNFVVAIQLRFDESKKFTVLRMGKCISGYLTLSAVSFCKRKQKLTRFQLRQRRTAQCTLKWISIRNTLIVQIQIRNSFEIFCFLLHAKQYTQMFKHTLGTEPTICDCFVRSHSSIRDAKVKEKKRRKWIARACTRVQTRKHATRSISHYLTVNCSIAIEQTHRMNSFVFQFTFFALSLLSVRFGGCVLAAFVFLSPIWMSVRDAWSRCVCSCW